MRDATVVGTARPRQSHGRDAQIYVERDARALRTRMHDGHNTEHIIMRARIGPRVDPTSQRPTIGEQQFQLGGAAVDVSRAGQMRVMGTSANDRISLERIKGGVRLTVDGESRDLMGKLSGARILGNAGDDRIVVGPRLGFPVVARGGAGDDVVKRPRAGLDESRDQFAGTVQGSSAMVAPRAPPMPGATTTNPESTATAAFNYDALLNDE